MELTLSASNSRAFLGGRRAAKMTTTLRKIEKYDDRGEMKKIELLPTWDCEASYTSTQARSQGVRGVLRTKSGKRSTFGHKVGQKWDVEGRFKKSTFWVQRSTWGVLHPQIRSWLRACFYQPYYREGVWLFRRGWLASLVICRWNPSLLIWTKWIIYCYFVFFISNVVPNIIIIYIPP